MPNVGGPIQSDEQSLRYVQTEQEYFPPGARRVEKPKVHSAPGRLQEDSQDRPRWVIDTAWPLGKAKIAKHPGHPNQDIHDPRKRKQIAREAMSKVRPVSYERAPISPALRRRVLGDSPRCVWCKYESAAKTPKDRRKEYDVDHIVAVSRGGENKEHLLRPACIFCNRARGNRPVSQAKEWVEQSKRRRMSNEERLEDYRNAMAEAQRRLRGV